MSFLKASVVFGLLFALTGCGGTADALGLGRNPPDEFAVVDRPPLSMPPEFGLRPPRPGAPRPQEVSMPDRASTVLFGEDGTGNGSSEESSTEKALLKQAGAEKANPGIRELIDRESAQKAVGNTHLVEELLSWGDPSASAMTVDSGAEAARIKETREKGEPITTGATPVIEKNKSGWLGL